MKPTKLLLTMIVVIGAYLLGPWLFSGWIRVPLFANGFGIVEQQYGSSRILSVATAIALIRIMSCFPNRKQIFRDLWRRALGSGTCFLIAVQLLFLFSICTDYLMFLDIGEKFVAVNDIDALRYDFYLHAINQLLVPLGIRIDSVRGHFMISSSLRHWGFGLSRIEAWRPWLYFTLSWLWLISVSLSIYKATAFASKQVSRVLPQRTNGLSTVIPVLEITRKTWTWLLLLTMYCNMRQTMVLVVEKELGLWRLAYLGMGYVLLAMLLGLIVFSITGWLWKSKVPADSLGRTNIKAGGTE